MSVGRDLSVICAVCGRGMEPDTDHVEVEVTHKRLEDRDEIEEYSLHDRCAWNTIDSWEEPY
jgi:hypothetical protein